MTAGAAAAAGGARIDAAAGGARAGAAAGGARAGAAADGARAGAAAGGARVGAAAVGARVDAAAGGPPFDLVVIGAGVVGALVACRATERCPRWRILVLDRSAVASGATRWSAGLDIPLGHSPWRRELCAESMAWFDRRRREAPELPIADLPLACVVSRARLSEVSSWFVGPPPRQAAAADLAQLREAYPDLRLAADQVLLVGAACRRAAAADLSRQLLAALPGDRVAVWEATAVTSVETGPAGGLAVELAAGRRLPARRVVLATGPWALLGPGAALARDAGIRVKKVAALHLDASCSPGQPVLLFLDEDAFLLPLGEARLAAAGARDRQHALRRQQLLFSFNCRTWDCEPDPGRLIIAEAERGEALACLARYCPELARQAAGGRVFCDAYGPDRSPVVAAAPGMPGVVLAGAGSGSGVRLAPALARQALERLLAVPAPPPAGLYGETRRTKRYVAPQSR
jgi:D-arginine dehydrogenase